jgi:hypothetical protein
MSLCLTHDKNICCSVPESLAHLIGTIVFYMQESVFDPWTLQLFTLLVDFQATRLPDQNK